MAMLHLIIACRVIVMHSRTELTYCTPDSGTGSGLEAETSEDQ